MVEVVLVTTVIVSAIVFGFAFRAGFYSTQMGKFSILPVGQNGNSLLTSDYGQFLLDNEKKQLRVRPKDGEEVSIPYDEIKGLKYGYDTQFAFLPEFLFGSWPLFKEHEDTYEWFHIYVVLKNREKIPLYSIGNYEQREFAFGWWIAIEKAILRKLGTLEDIASISQNAFESVLALFKEGG